MIDTKLLAVQAAGFHQTLVDKGINADLAFQLTVDFSAKLAEAVFNGNVNLLALAESDK